MAGRVRGCLAGGGHRRVGAPDEVFSLVTDIVAVDGLTAVVRAEVRYGDAAGQEYRDLWGIRFGGDGRCDWFEEWPFWPGRPTRRATTWCSRI